MGKYSCIMVKGLLQFFCHMVHAQGDNTQDSRRGRCNTQEEFWKGRVTRLQTQQKMDTKTHDESVKKSDVISPPVGDASQLTKLTTAVPIAPAEHIQPVESAARKELTKGMTNTYRDVWNVGGSAYSECPEWLMRSLRAVLPLRMADSTDY